MDKKTIKKLIAKYGADDLAKWLGVSVRTVGGWKYERCPSPLLANQLKELAK